MRLLIVSLDAYSLFDTSTQYIFGGAEFRSFLFAKELAQMPNVEVTVVTRDHSKGNQKFGNVFLVSHPGKKGRGFWDKQKKVATRIKNKLVNIFVEKKDQPGIDFFFESLKPTHILIFGMGPEAVECLNYRRTAKLPFIFGCASDFDLSETYLQKETPLDVSGNDASQYANVLREADLVLVQSLQQEMMLEKRFGRKGKIISSPVSAETPKGVSPVATKSDVLWIGKTSAIKRPELFFELAKLLPSFRFRMILNNTNQEIFEKLVSGKSSNIEVVESVPVSSVEFYFMQTQLFVNTSVAEGFPNTFLQAGKYGVPIVSMNADPDHILSENGGGLISGNSLLELKESVLQLLNDKEMYKKCSENIRSCIKSNHEIGKVAKQLYDEVKQLKP